MLLTLLLQHCARPFVPAKGARWAWMLLLSLLLLLLLLHGARPWALHCVSPWAPDGYGQP